MSLIMQDEAIRALQALTESIASQQQTTQLTIVIVILLLVFGAIMIVLLRGGIQVFNKLSNAIDKLADVESQRHKTQEDMVEAIERFSSQNIERYERVDIMWRDVIRGLRDLNNRLDGLHELLSSNPDEHKKMYDVIVELKDTLERTKKKTDELPELE